MLILTLLSGPLALASCAPVNSGCAGWERIMLDAATVDYLAANDTRTLAGIVAHAEFGQVMGCWE